MPSNCRSARVERARPWLGTIVSIRADAPAADAALQAIESAFVEIAMIHRRMSFHDPASDVSRLNACAHREPLRVHSYTYRVLQKAAAISERTEGAFDVTLGSELVKWGFLPNRGDEAGCGGQWNDIQFEEGNRIRFRRPLCIDLGGIAKGFAIDTAIKRLQKLGCTAGVVNAGGDLRVFGNQEERIALRVSRRPAAWPSLLVAEGSVASSSGRWNRRRRQGIWHGTHIDGRDRKPVETNRFVSVVSRDCVTADALTKVVLALGQDAEPVLREFRASACLFSPGSYWRVLGSAA